MPKTTKRVFRLATVLSLLTGVAFESNCTVEIWELIIYVLGLNDEPADLMGLATANEVLVPQAQLEVKRQQQEIEETLRLYPFRSGWDTTDNYLVLFKIHLGTDEVELSPR